MKALDLFCGYKIQEDGSIISPAGKSLTPQKTRQGYMRIEIAGRKYSVHRLLADAFIPNPGNKPQVNHIDGNKANNTLSNLEWVTQRENQLHAYKIGLQVGFRKAVPLSISHKRALCGSRWNYERHIYRLDGLTFYKLEAAASNFGVSEQTILNRCKSGRWPGWLKTVELRAA